MVSLILINVSFQFAMLITGMINFSM